MCADYHRVLLTCTLRHSPKFYWDDLVQSNDAARVRHSCSVLAWAWARLKIRRSFLVKPEDNEICSVGSATADLGELVSSVPPSDAQGAASRVFCDSLARALSCTICAAHAPPSMVFYSLLVHVARCLCALPHRRQKGVLRTPSSPGTLSCLAIVLQP